MKTLECRIEIAGQTAIVTGASSGIGAGIAEAFGRAGARVVVNYSRSREEADRVVEIIRESGGEAFAFQASVGKESEVKALFEAAVGEYGTVDVLVSNAGIQKDDSFLDMTAAHWQEVMDINLTGAFLCAREAAREFVRRGVVPERSAAAGKIIFVSSVHEVIPWAGHVNYAASKGGIALFMKSIAQELAPYRIRVNSIAPGAIRTRINRAAWETAEAEAKLLELIPYGRLGEPADIANAALWLASDESDYVHGTTLYVDGGMTLYPGFARSG